MPLKAIRQALPVTATFSQRAVAGLVIAGTSLGAVTTPLSSFRLPPVPETRLALPAAVGNSVDYPGDSSVGMAATFYGARQLSSVQRTADAVPLPSKALGVIVASPKLGYDPRRQHTAPPSFDGPSKVDSSQAATLGLDQPASFYPTPAQSNAAASRSRADQEQIEEVVRLSDPQLWWGSSGLERGSVLEQPPALAAAAVVERDKPNPTKLSYALSGLTADALTVVAPMAAAPVGTASRSGSQDLVLSPYVQSSTELPPTQESSAEVDPYFETRGGSVSTSTSELAIIAKVQGGRMEAITLFFDGGEGHVGSSISLRLADLLRITSPLMAIEEYEAMKNLSSMEAYVTFNDLRMAGLGVGFDEHDRLVIKAN